MDYRLISYNQYFKFFMKPHHCVVFTMKKIKKKTVYNDQYITILLVQNNLPFKINEISVSEKTECLRKKFEILYDDQSYTYPEHMFRC